jgi:anti-sigma B factor antagonist
VTEGVIGKLTPRRWRQALPGQRLPAHAACRPALSGRAAASRDVLPRPSGAGLASRGFRIERRLEPDRSVLVPIGELDVSAVGSFEQATAGLVNRGRPIVVDLSKVLFIDSCGLWSITTIYSTCRQRGVGIGLWPGSARVQQLFEVTGLYDVLPFTEPRRGKAP